MGVESGFPIDNARYTAAKEETLISSEPVTLEAHIMISERYVDERIHVNKPTYETSL